MLEHIGADADPAQTLLFQPQVSLSTGQICGVVVVGPGAGLLPPSLADEHIDKVDVRLLRAVCRQARAWQDSGLKMVRTTIPLSSRFLRRPDVVKRMEAIVLEVGVEPALLGIEFTEDLFSQDSAHTVRALTELKAIGFELVLAHFGVGSSSIRLLSQLPLNALKIDGSLVGDIVADLQSVSLSRTIIGMAHGLQMQVLADGVQTEAQLAQLVAHRCDRVQGGVFSPPLSASELADCLKAEHHLTPESIGIQQASRTLLVVDDEPHIVASLRRLLRRDGYRILEANSGQDGLRLLAENDVSVIMSDQRMPCMTGVEFLRQAKTLYPDTIRIVLSGYTELQSITDAINEGAIYKFLTKPWDDELLRQQVADAFKQKDMAHENHRLSLQISETNHELAEVNRRLQSVLDSRNEQIRRHQVRLETANLMLAGIPVPVVGIDAEGMVAFVNNRAEEVIASAGAMLGNLADEVLPMALRPNGPARSEGLTLGPVSYRVLHTTIGSDQQVLGTIMTLLPIEAACPPDIKSTQASPP